MTLIQKKENSYNYILAPEKKSHIFLIALLFFSINPPLSIIFLITRIIKQQGKEEQSFFALYTFLALYLGLIMSTKEPISDWLNYKIQFELAESKNFIEYIIYFKKEPVFYIINFILYKIFVGSFTAYAVTIIFIGYFLFFISIHKFWRYFSNNYSIILFSILFFAFFNNHFSNSGHLTRQVLAGSFFIFFFIEKIVNKRNRWLFVIMAVLIHSSSALLFIIIFIPSFVNKFSIKRFLVIFISFLVFSALGGVVYSYFNNLTSSISWLNYGFQRIETIDSLKTTWYEGGGTFGNRVYYFFLLAIVIRVYVFKIVSSKEYYLFNVLIALVFLQEYYVISGLLFLQLRFMVYIFLFIPFVLPYIFNTNLKRNNTFIKIEIIQTVLVVASIVRFFLRRNSGEFQYDSIIELLINPPIIYFFQ